MFKYINEGIREENISQIRGLSPSASPPETAFSMTNLYGSFYLAFNSSLF